jgi:hypothetical protein
MAETLSIDAGKACRIYGRDLSLLVRKSQRRRIEPLAIWRAVGDLSQRSAVVVEIMSREVAECCPNLRTGP